MVDLTKNKFYKEKYTKKWIGSAAFLLTENCNLQCRYCYEKDRTKDSMTEEVAKGGLNFLFQEAISGGIDKVSIMLFGGEPTLEPDIIKYIIEEGIELSQKYNIGFFVQLVTNTVTLPDKLYVVLEKYRRTVDLAVQMSIDGPKHVQDIERLALGGISAFDKIEKTVHKYKKLFHDEPDRLSVHGVLTRDNLPYLYESYKFFRYEWKMNKIWFIPDQEQKWTLDDVRLYSKQSKMILNDIIRLMKEEKSIEPIKNYAPIDRCLIRQLAFSKPCGAGDNFLAVTATGDLYPCPQIYYNDLKKETLVGNVWDGVDDDKLRMFKEYSPEDISCPSTCDHYHCYRCIAANWQVNKSLFTQIRGNYCKMMKVDYALQKRLKKVVKEMGLLEKNNNEEIKPIECMCKYRGNSEEMALSSREYTFEKWSKDNIMKVQLPDGTKEYIEVSAEEKEEFKKLLSTNNSSTSKDVFAKAILILFNETKKINKKLDELVKKDE